MAPSVPGTLEATCAPRGSSPIHQGLSGREGKKRQCINKKAHVVSSEVFPIDVECSWEMTQMTDCGCSHTINVLVFSFLSKPVIVVVNWPGRLPNCALFL